MRNTKRQALLHLCLTILLTSTLNTKTPKRPIITPKQTLVIPLSKNGNSETEDGQEQSSTNSEKRTLKPLSDTLPRTTRSSTLIYTASTAAVSPVGNSACGSTSSAPSSFASDTPSSCVVAVAGAAVSAPTSVVAIGPSSTA